MSKWEELAVDTVNIWYEAYVDLAIEHNDFEKLRGIGEGESSYFASAGQMQKQDSITRKKDLAIEREKRRIAEEQIISANLLKSYCISTPSSKTNYVSTPSSEKKQEDIASKAIDMLIESLGNEAEQATSREMLEDIQDRAWSIRPIHPDSAILYSQQERIASLIENIGHLIENDINLQLDQIYATPFNTYDEFQELVRKGIRVLSGLEYSALDFKKFYEANISVKSTIESALATQEEDVRKANTVISMQIR